MQHNRVEFLFMNAGHFLDHLFVLIFATAALRLTSEWGLSYAELIPYATPGFVAFGVAAIPAGWLADRWSREGMMAVFFIGAGLSAMLAGLADTPMQMALCLTLVGLFAAIYHPVGLAIVVQVSSRTGMALAVNGIFGNLGVAAAALITGFLVDASGWRSAFMLPGALSVAVGLLYLSYHRARRPQTAAAEAGPRSSPATAALPRRTLFRLFGVILFTSALGGLIFQSTTFSLPKVFDERLAAFAGSTTSVGAWSFVVFSVAAFAQLGVGHLVDKHPVRTVFAAVALAQSLFLIAMTQVEGAAALLVAIAFMLTVFSQVPINDVLIGRVVRSHWRSRAFALRSIVSFSVMAATLPLVAWLHSNWGFGVLFGLLSAAALAIFVAVLLLPAERRPVPVPSTAWQGSTR